MKKLIGVCLSILLSLGLMPGGIAAPADKGFGVGNVTGFFVSGDKSMINEAWMRRAEPVEAMAKLLNESKSPESSPKDAEETATVTLELSGGDRQAFTILADDKGMYARNGNRLLQISAEDFHKTLNAYGNELYRYRSMPSLELRENGSGSGPLHIESSTYAYRKLDRKYYKPYFQQDGIDYSLDTSGPWPTLSFDLEPETVSVQVKEAGSAKTVFTGNWDKAGAYVKSGGKGYDISVTATYQGKLFRGTVTYAFTAEQNGSTTGQVKFSIEENSTFPGEVMVLRVQNAGKDDKVRFTSDINFTPNFFEDGTGGKIALMPVSYFTATGEHTLNLSCAGESVKWSVSVKDKKFQIQNLVVDSTTSSNTIDSQKANTEYENAIAPLRSVADGKRYWDRFTWPVTGPVTTEFGMIRYTNGKPTSSRHGAIDFAVPKGTPVKATANGRILYAGFLQLTGNTVLIEHGYGLKSWYYHMDSLNVKTGEMVKISQEIGKVGSTGFSTGAHLHFGMSVNNVFVNPTTVIDTDLLK